MPNGSVALGKLCVSLAQKDIRSLFEQVETLPDCVDVVEVRLDAMVVPEIGACCEGLKRPVLFTLRPVWEGGTSSLTDSERASILLKASEHGAAYLDWELAADVTMRKQLLDVSADSPTKMIISSHDFVKTSNTEQLSDILQQMIDSGAHIGKIVTTANNVSDVLRVLSLQEKAALYNFPLCAFCMGEIGRISRFATLFLGGYMSYFAPDASSATAPGQMTLSDFLLAAKAFHAKESQ